jgi:hypothetical protein
MAINWDTRFADDFLIIVGPGIAIGDSKPVITVIWQDGDPSTPMFQFPAGRGRNASKASQPPAPRHGRPPCSRPGTPMASLSA